VRRIAWIGLLGLLVSGLAGAQQQAPDANPIANPGAPWPFAGFIVNVPDIQDLYSVLVGRDSAAIGKRAVNPTRIWAFTALTLRPGRTFKSSRELADHMRSRREIGLQPKRYTKLTHEEQAATHLGQACTRYLVRALDRGDKGDESVPMQFRGLTCVHPGRPDLLVDLAYSERGGEGAMSEVLTKAGGQFLGSLRFLSLEAPPAMREASARERAGDMAGSLALLKSLAEAGDTRAAAELGRALVEGRGVPAEPEQGRKWLEAAAKDGWVTALYSLGVVYDKGIGVPRDPEAAAKWFSLAADQRDAQAQLNLGVYEWNGENAKRNPRKACNWWRMAAGNGNPRAETFFRDNDCKQFEPPAVR
jgi:Sel1 repeat